MRQPAVDLTRLLRLRLVVARHGEMDAARWWNSRGMLGRHGALVLARGFPRTHYFTQARVVFAIARSRCNELFRPPGCMTLWHLPAALEDQFDEHWQHWLDEADTWTPFFQELATVQGDDLLKALGAFRSPVASPARDGRHPATGGRRPCGATARHASAARRRTHAARGGLRPW